MKRLLYLTYMFLTWLCISGCAGHTRDVVVVWRTSQDDVVYQQFHRQIKKEFRSRGYDVRLFDCFLENGKYSGKTLAEHLSSTIDEVILEGGRPDLILAYGDFCHHIVMLDNDERLNDIPIVSFGVYSPEISGRPHPRRVVLIRDSITVKENLDFAKSIFNDRSRIISLLDTRTSWVDRSIMNNMSAQMERLDSSRYFNGLGLHCSVKDLEDAAGAGKTVYYALSIDNVSTNKNPETGEFFPVSWAFFSRKSDNRVLMVKHDHVSEMLQFYPELPRYCTAVAEGFGIFDNCVGGHFSPFDVQLEDAVDKAVMLWDGADPAGIPETWHKRDYHVNWDALRGMVPLSSMPDYVDVRNTRLSDRQPLLARMLRYVMLLAFALVTGVLFITLQHYIARNIAARKELARGSKESIERMESLNMLLKGTNSKSWNIIGDNIVYEGGGSGSEDLHESAKTLRPVQPFL